jgi:hypothetical protein
MRSYSFHDGRVTHLLERQQQSNAIQKEFESKNLGFAGPIFPRLPGISTEMP